MVRNLTYDCGELAIVTYLQAKAYGKPIVLLPFVVSGNFHHKSIAYNSDKGALTPATLPGAPRRRAHILADDGRVGARHPSERLRRRSRQGHLGDVRRRASGRAHRPQELRARAGGQEAGRHAARRRAGRRHARLQHAQGPQAEAADPQSGAGGEGMGCQVRRHADQSHVHGDQGAGRLAARRRPQPLRHARRNQVDHAVAVPERASTATGRLWNSSANTPSSRRSFRAASRWTNCSPMPPRF